MKAISNITTIERIQEAALARFAAHGYEGTSLADIAGDVGIKKPSIYAHFKNKDELYLRLVSAALAHELGYARQALRGGPTIRKQLHAYLRSTLARFDESPRIRFWLRAFYLPPGHLVDHPSFDELHAFVDELEAIIEESIKDSPLGKRRGALAAGNLANTYFSLLIGVQTELLFDGPNHFERRFKAVWAVFDKVMGLAEA